MYPHLFTTLSWNLFARSHSVASLMFVHFDWQDDCLVITVPRHKGDQEGARIFPVHVYANPLMPTICPILSLALYVFCSTLHADTCNEWKLFAGAHTEGKFSNWLHELVEDLHRQVNRFESELVGTPSEVGTHSFRYEYYY